MPINLDWQSPELTGSDGVPLDYTVIEAGKVPIFWGDNQVLRNSDSKYNYPSGMTKDSTLSVPKVGRFLYTFAEDSSKINDWNDAQADDCTGDGEPDGSGCLDNVDKYYSYVTIQSCFPSFFSATFVGHTLDAFGGFSGICHGSNYWTDVSFTPGISPIGNPCSAIILVVGVKWPDPPGRFDGTNLGAQIPFIYYEGPVRGYNPSSVDISKYWLPIVTSYGGCCGDGGPPVPLPPPPPPPTDHTGCGSEGGG